jgi:hypothetical protein
MNFWIVKADGGCNSSCLGAKALEATPVHRKRFGDLMIKCMTFVMDKLGAKGVFHNTLLFSGRFLVSQTIACAHVLTVMIRPSLFSGYPISGSSLLLSCSRQGEL